MFFIDFLFKYKYYFIFESHSKNYDKYILHFPKQNSNLFIIYTFLKYYLYFLQDTNK